MKRYEDSLDILKENGYDGTINESDFYFRHRKEIDPRLYGRNVSSEEFANKVRWKSAIGIECSTSIIAYLHQKMKEKDKESYEKFRVRHDLIMNDPDWERKVPMMQDDFFATIDFSDFRFQFNGRSWSLNQFVYSFPLQQRIGGQKDLIGIDLSGIKLRNCRLVNLCFAEANFDNADFSQVQLIGTSFPNASFRNASLGSVSLNQGSYLNYADMTGAGIYGLFPLNDKALSEPFKYSKVSYRYLVVNTLKSMLHIKSKTMIGREKGKHTAFAGVRTTELTLPHTRQIKEYIAWYESTMERINGLPQSPFYKKIMFLLSVVATKHWTSYGALGLFALILNLLFTGLYWLLGSHFKGMPNDFTSIFYGSTLVFTSLGLEGIRPVTGFGQLLVISEVISGFIVLGLFVFLLTRKVDRQY